MKFELQMNDEGTHGTLFIRREPGDKRISDESQLLHHVKLWMKQQGYDAIKKRMWKDGHMIGDDTNQYVRERKPTAGRQQSGRQLAIYNANYAIRDAAEELRGESGKTTLNVTNLVLSKVS